MCDFLPVLRDKVVLCPELWFLFVAMRTLGCMQLPFMNPLAYLAYGFKDLLLLIIWVERWKWM